MSMTDPIADLLTRIRNGYLARHDRVDVPASKIKVEVCRILQEQGYIEGYDRVTGEPADELRIHLRYDGEGRPVIRHIQRVSRPGRRVYRKTDAIEPVLNGLGVGIISTSQGLMSDAQARQQRIGGEVLCEVW